VGAGDFNADLQTDLVWRDQGNTGNVVIWYMNGTVRQSSVLVTASPFPALNWQIQGIGDFNADSKPDLVWRDQGNTGNVAIWFMNGSVRQGSALVTGGNFPPLSWQIQGVSDVNADTKPDLLWRDQGGTGNPAAWYMNGVAKTGSALLNPSSFPNLNWRIVGAAKDGPIGTPDRRTVPLRLTSAS
jgi:hypothetical protein